MIASFAKLDSDNNVTDIFVVDQADIDNNGGDVTTESENWVKTNVLKDDSISIKQFFLDGSFRVNPAEVGGYYDTINDVFISVNIFPSWSLNSNFQWEAPVPKPDNYIDPLVPDYIGAPFWNEVDQEWHAFNINLDKITWNPSTSVWE